MVWFVIFWLLYVVSYLMVIFWTLSAGCMLGLSIFHFFVAEPTLGWLHLELAVWFALPAILSALALNNMNKGIELAKMNASVPEAGAEEPQEIVTDSLGPKIGLVFEVLGNDLVKAMILHKSIFDDGQPISDPLIADINGIKFPLNDKLADRFSLINNIIRLLRKQKLPDTQIKTWFTTKIPTLYKNEAPIDIFKVDWHSSDPAVIKVWQHACFAGSQSH